MHSASCLPLGRGFRALAEHVEFLCHSLRNYCKARHLQATRSGCDLTKVGINLSDLCRELDRIPSQCVGGKPPDAATVWKHAAADRGAVASGGIAEAVAGNRSRVRGDRGGCQNPISRPWPAGLELALGHADRVPSLGPALKEKR